jgi:hypothetical protein
MRKKRVMKRRKPSQPPRLRTRRSVPLSKLLLQLPTRSKRLKRLLRSQKLRSQKLRSQKLKSLRLKSLRPKSLNKRRKNPRMSNLRSPSWPVV